MPDPNWWLDHLTRRMDERAPSLRLLRSYLEGRPPLPEGAEGCREAFAAFQRKSRRNFAALVPGSIAARMRVAGFRVGDSSVDDDRAREIWKANRLGVWSRDVHMDMLSLRCGYVAVQQGADGAAEALWCKPEQTIVETDPHRPDRRRAALTVWRDDVAGEDAALLMLPGERHAWRRATPEGADGRPRPITTYHGGWIAQGGEVSTADVPIVPFTNAKGVAEIEPHLDLLDSINWTVLQRLVIIAAQAFKQRGLKGDFPEKDEDGKLIDYDDLFRPGPGALWMLPEGTEIWESGQADVAGVLKAAESDVRDLAAVTNTPMSVMLPDGANQTAEGANFAREGHVFTTEDRIERAKVSWSEVMRLAFEVQYGESPEIDVEFAPAAVPSMAERYDALSKAGADVPWRTKMTDVLGIDGDKVDRMAAERAEDAMLAAITAPPPPGPDDEDQAADDGADNKQA